MTRLERRGSLRPSSQTDPDGLETAAVPRLGPSGAVVCDVLVLEVGKPLRVRLAGGEVWETATSVQVIDRGRRFADVRTKNTVYRLHGSV